MNGGDFALLCLLYNLSQFVHVMPVLARRFTVVVHEAEQQLAADLSFTIEAYYIPPALLCLVA